LNKRIFAIAAACILLGCGASRTVTRIDPGETIDLSGEWNDSDSRLVATEMTRDCLAQAWQSNFTQQAGKLPVVTVGTIRNNTSEHINSETFTTDFERELINSGKVEFVASRDQRGEIREERNDQQRNASDESAKRLAQELGADFLLIGAVQSIVDQVEGRRVTFYQVDLQLVNIESNKTVWIGSKKIKKDIGRSKSRL
jgi:penicillin-binding protein activator